MYWRVLKEGLLVRGQEMTYEDWNSYTATMRTYTMGLRDLALARTWARLETRAPHMRTVAAGLVTEGTIEQRARAVAWLAPRVATLGALRVYAGWKLRQEEKAAPTLRATRAGVAPVPMAAVPMAAVAGSSGSPDLVEAGRRPRGIPVAVRHNGESARGAAE